MYAKWVALQQFSSCNLQIFMTFSSLQGSFSFAINVNEDNIGIDKFCHKSR